MVDIGDIDVSRVINTTVNTLGTTPYWRIALFTPVERSSNHYWRKFRNVPKPNSLPLL